MSNSQNNRPERSRNFSLITYHNEETIKACLSVPVVRHWAYILHDKDHKEDQPEEPKEKHFHVLLNLNNSLTESAVRKLFPASQNTLTQIMRDNEGCYSYLTHSNSPEKYQYPIEDIKCDDRTYWEALQGGSSVDKTEMLLNMLDDINAHVPMREMCRRYGRDFVRNLNKYEAMADKLRREEEPPKDISAHVVLFDNTQMQIVDPETGETVIKPR